MSMERHGSHQLETFFSFEFLVDYVQFDKEINVSDWLALGIRLLDFPTLLIYQPERRDREIIHRELAEGPKRGKYDFNRGKSCFFKMNLDSLQAHLSNTPLYAMVLDVTEEIPKLVGNSTLSLATVMDKIREDVRKHGVSTHSSHGERGLVSMNNLQGERVGSLSVSYKLLTLGVSLHGNVTERRDINTEGHKFVETPMGNNVETKPIPLSRKVTLSSPENSYIQSQDNTLLNMDNQDNSLCETENKTRSQTPQSPQENECFEEDLTVFCPPHLYYSNSGEKESKYEGSDYKFLKKDSQDFTTEDTSSPNDNQQASVVLQTAQHTNESSNNQETSVGIPNVLGEALRQLPLLNALLIEVSQLNIKSAHKSLPVHPILAQIYKSAESSNVQTSTPQNETLHSTQGANHRFKHLHSSGKYSSEIMRPASERLLQNIHREPLMGISTSRKTPGKKLVYGTTKTFHLRLKKNSSTGKHRECIELIQNETQSVLKKGNTKSSDKISVYSRKISNQKSFREDIKTTAESIAVDSDQNKIVLQKSNIHASDSMMKINERQDGDSQPISEILPSSERDIKSIHNSTKERESVAINNKNQIESNQFLYQYDSRREKIQSSGCSRHSSPKSLSSEPSRERSLEPDYTDDFNSLGPSDAYSSDPASSPEARTPKPPVCPHSHYSDSGSESIQKRTVLPTPIKACSSPQRSVRGTYVVHRRNQSSALSSSSDLGDKSDSEQPTCSRKGMTGWSSGAGTLRSSAGQSRESNRSGPPAQESSESVSSFKPEEFEAQEDEFESLDFRKEYQQISDLVVNNLCGYTM